MTAPNNNPLPQEQESRVGGGRKVHLWIALLSVVLLVILIFGGVFVAGPSVRADLLALYGPAVTGIPAAIPVATMVVSGICAHDDEGGLSSPSTAIKGGVALMLGWLAVFAAMVLAIRALW